MVSVYVVPVDTYIMHDPAGFVARHVVMLPADTYPLGHVEFATTMDFSSMVAYPLGHDVAGAVAYEVAGTNERNRKIFFITNAL